MNMEAYNLAKRMKEIKKLKANKQDAETMRTLNSQIEQQIKTGKIQEPKPK